VPVEVLESLRADSSVRVLAWIKDPSAVYGASDVVVLPTYREGLGVVLLEGAAMRLPTVASDVPGCREAVADGVTGTLIAARRPAALAEAILTYAANPALRMRHGEAGRQRVLRDFRPEDLRRATLDQYMTLWEQSARHRNQLHKATKRFRGSGITISKTITKRLVDVIGALACIAILGPLMVVSGVMVMLSLGLPVVFRQRRVGLHGQAFWLYKLRTMRSTRGPGGELLPDSERLCRVGVWLRRLSLDELPQLLNVLAGNMSLVGPRPLLPEYLPRYTQEQRRRHDVKPGITGWAQIHGRNSVSWEKKFELDLWYVDRWTIYLDIKILIMTAIRVLRRDGVSHQDHASMPEFLGARNGRA
jgi:lipopolysaccharide/colanic/teichoic acid biosynthesis glycosyltransferase